MMLKMKLLRKEVKINQFIVNKLLPSNLYIDAKGNKGRAELLDEKNLT